MTVAVFLEEALQVVAAAFPVATTKVLVDPLAAVEDPLEALLETTGTANAPR